MMTYVPLPPSQRQPSALRRRKSSRSPLTLLASALCLRLCLLSFLLVIAGPRVVGAVDGLTLKSLAPGELHIEWEVPESNPTDYRVNWAPFQQSFPSWREDYGNDYLADSSLTLQGLDPGVRYKVQVRARYRGSHLRGHDADPFSAVVTQRIDEYGEDVDSAAEADTGNTLEGWIDSAGDVDWIELEAQAGTSYHVSVAGEGTFNVLLIGVYDADGVAVDSGISWSGVAALLFTPASGGTYYVSVAGLDEETGSYAVSVDEGEPRGMITGLTVARNAAGDLTVSWDAASHDPKDYRLGWALLEDNFRSWRDATGNAYPTGTSHTVTGLDAGAAYKVQVRARYAGAGSGPWARAISGRAPVALVVRDDEPVLQSLPVLSERQQEETDPLFLEQQTATPAKPTGLQATDHLDEGVLTVRLQWDDPSDDSITEYEVRRRTGTDSLALLETISFDAGAVVTSYVDASAAFGTAYDYDIAARNSDGLGDRSDTASITTPSRQSSPEPPLIASAEGTDTQVTVSWVRNVRNFHVQGYRIKRGDNSAHLETLVQLVPAEHPFHDPEAGPQIYVDTDVLPGVDYHYRVFAVNEWGESREGVRASASTYSRIPPGLRAAATHDTVTLSWDDPEDDAVTGYRILRSTDGGEEQILASRIGGDAVRYVDRNLRPGTAYAYRVQALRSGTPGTKTRFVSMLTLPVPGSAATLGAGSEPAGGDLPPTIDTSGRIGLGETVTGRFHRAGDQDWFSLDLTAGETYFIEIRGRGVEPLPLPRFYCTGTIPTGGTWGSDADRDCWHVSGSYYRANVTGRYFITVDPDIRNAIGDYEIELRRAVGDDASTTARAAADEWVSGELLSRYDRDWYRVRLCAGHSYRVDYYYQKDTGWTDGHAPNLGTPRFELYDLIGEQAGNVYRNHTAPPFLFKAPPRTGTYFLGIDTSGDLGPGRYRFRMEDIDAQEDLSGLRAVSEPSGSDLPASTRTAGFLPFGQSVKGEVESSDDRDWFRVRFDDRLCDRVYWLRLKGADSSDGTLADPYIAGVFDANGNRIPYSWTAGQLGTLNSDSGEGRNTIIDFTPHEAGEFYVEVGGERGATGTYTLALIDVTDTSTSEEGDVDFAADTQISREDYLVGNLVPGMPASAELNLNLNDAGDIFRLQTEVGRYYRIEVKGQETGHGTIDEPYMFILPMFAYPATTFLEPGDVLFYYDIESDSSAAANPSLEFKATERLAFDPSFPFVWHVSIGLAPGTYTVEMTDITDTGDDCRGASHTGCEVRVGGSATGTLDVDGDVDWFRVDLPADKGYRIRLQGADSGGGTLADPALRLIIEDLLTPNLFNYQAGNDDESSATKDSEILFNATRPRAMYRIEAYTPGTGTGTYTLSVEEVN